MYCNHNVVIMSELKYVPVTDPAFEPPGVRVGEHIKLYSDPTEPERRMYVLTADIIYKQNAIKQ
jgi:hypothetical protein